MNQHIDENDAINSHVKLIFKNLELFNVQTLNINEMHCVTAYTLHKLCLIYIFMAVERLCYLRYSSPKSASRKTDQARSSVNGLDVGTLSTSPNCNSSNTKYSESSSGSSSTSTNFTTFGWSNWMRMKEK